MGEVLGINGHVGSIPHNAQASEQQRSVSRRLPISAARSFANQLSVLGAIGDDLGGEILVRRDQPSAPEFKVRWRAPADSISFTSFGYQVPADPAVTFFKDGPIAGAGLPTHRRHPGRLGSSERCGDKVRP